MEMEMEAHNFGSILALEASEVQVLESEVAKEVEARARAWREWVLTVSEDLAVRRPGCHLNFLK